MKFPEIQSLTADLQEGLGEFDPDSLSGYVIRSHEQSLRLSLEGTCGLASIALNEHLLQAGHDSRIVLSKPNLAFDPDKQHVFIRVMGEQGTTIIDPTYSHLLDYAGITPGYATSIGKSWLFPERKVAVFAEGGQVSVAAQLATTATFIMRTVTTNGEKRELDPYSGAEMVHELSKIWLPENFHPYEPSEATIQGGLKLAKFILPQHARLVA